MKWKPEDTNQEISMYLKEYEIKKGKWTEQIDQLLMLLLKHNVLKHNAENGRLR